MVLFKSCVPEDCRTGCSQYSSGANFRSSLYRPTPNLYSTGRFPQPIRLVPAFTVQAMQKNTKVLTVPKSEVYDAKPKKSTKFRKFYNKGSFPAYVEFSNTGKLLAWKIPPENLDYNYYLPILFDGLAETMYPYTFIVQEGINAMLTNAPSKVLPVVPLLIMPLKNALSTKRHEVLCNTMRAIQMLVTKCDRVGVALVPYYRQLLLVFNLFKNKNKNIGSKVDYSSSRGENLGDLIGETLQLLERTGGPDAFINIKYMIPTYESCIVT